MRLTFFRKISQLFFLAFFLLLFFLWVYPFTAKLPVRLFLESDPLISIVSMIASRAFISTMILGLVILLLTLVLGRFFCGYICPLGTLIDLTGWVVVGRH